MYLYPYILVKSSRSKLNEAYILSTLLNQRNPVSLTAEVF